MIIDGQSEAYLSAGSFIESGAHRAVVSVPAPPAPPPAGGGGFAGVEGVATPLFVDVGETVGPLTVDGDVRAPGHRVAGRATVSARRQASGAVVGPGVRLTARARVRPTGEDDWLLLDME